MWLWEYLNVWILAGVAAVAGLLLVGDWLLSGWITNLLRNHVEAKRRERFTARGECPDEPRAAPRQRRWERPDESRRR